MENKTFNIQHIVDIAMCTNCQAGLFYKIKYAECFLCKKRYGIKDNVLFLNIPPDNVPKRDTLKLAEKNWSNWRKENFIFLKEYIDVVSKDAIIFDLGAGRSPYREYLNKERFPKLISSDFGFFELIDIVADINKKLPFKDCSIDVIVLSNVLEHITDPVNMLSECYRVLKKDGLIIGHTPFLMGIHDEPYDFYRYTRYALGHLLKSTGFVKIIIKELSSTDDVLDSFIHKYFASIFKKKKFSLFIRLCRKGIFTVFALLRYIFGDVEDYIQPKGYGWVGHRDN